MGDVRRDQTVAIRIAKAAKIVRYDSKICPHCEAMISIRGADKHIANCKASARVFTAPRLGHLRKKKPSKPVRVTATRPVTQKPQEGGIERGKRRIEALRQQFLQLKAQVEKGKTGWKLHLSMRDLCRNIRLRHYRQLSPDDLALVEEVESWRPGPVAPLG